MSKPTTKSLILIDGSSYLHRAFHALPSLKTTKGEPTGAIYGVINMIRKLVSDYNPEYIAVVFDAKGKNFRHQLYPQYKAHRPPMEEELRVQINPLHEIIKAMGLPLLIIDGVEADDVIGTLTKQATQAGFNTIISTGDKDLAQLVDNHTTIINTMTNTVLDVANVKNKFGVTPEQIIDYLTLVGDTSDNIPGVPKVGPKTAVKWLEEYGSLKNIIQHADKIEGKVGENLRASLTMLPLSRELVTIKHDVALTLKPKDLKRTEPDNQKLAELFQHFEFKNWLASLTATAPTSSNPAIQSDQNHYQAILDNKDWQPWLTKLQQAPAFSLDLETTSLDPIQAEIVGISFAIHPHEAIYIPLAHDYLGAPSQLDRKQVLQQLKPLFEDPKKIKLGQNLKYDLNVLANYDIELKGIGFDTMLESYLLNSANNKHDKATLVLKYLGKTIITYEEVAGKGAKQLTFNQVPIEKATPYAASDADIVLQVHEVLWPQIAAHHRTKDIFQKIEMPMLTVLARMERTGVCINPKLLHEQSSEIAQRLTQLEKEVYQIAGEEFNLNSPLQLQEILFTKLKLPIMQKTPTGQPSTGEAVLQELSLDYPLPKLLLEYRGLSKLKSTYTDTLPEQINPKTKRIHTSYNQAVAVTGRLSSTNPNLQNIPIRTEEGRKIRRAFIAPHKHKIISADYSQIELRIMAHLSQDRGLIAAFQNDADVHRATAAEIFGVDLNKVTEEQRRNAKTINFGLIYGMSAFGLAKRLDLSRKEAERYIDLYFTRYPGVKHYMEAMRKQAREYGFVETMLGRQLLTPEINSKNFMRRAAAERAAINAPMQGSAAEIIKIAMINIDEWIQHSKLGIKMIMQVHDELVFEVADADVKTASIEIEKRMISAAKLDIPILVHIGVGDNWDEAH